MTPALVPRPFNPARAARGDSAGSQPTTQEKGTAIMDYLLYQALDIAEHHPLDRTQGRVRLTLRNGRGAVEGRVTGLTEEAVQIDDGSDFPIWVRIDAIDTFRYV